MRQIIAIALVALIATANAATTLQGAVNCTTALASDSNSLYNPPAGCITADSTLAACWTNFVNCGSTPPKACDQQVPCFGALLKCYEDAKPTHANCTNWLTALDNFELYLAAGGTYNGSALQASCVRRACQGAVELRAKGSFFTATNGAVYDCPVHSDVVCKEPIFVTNSPAPATGDTTVAPTAAPGRVVASFKLSGTQAEWQACIDKLGKARVINEIVNPLLTYILNSTAFVVTNVAPGSLQIDFYMTDDSTPDQIINKLGSATIDPNDSRISGALALAKNNGVATTIGVVPGSATAATQAPNPGPGPTSASAVAVLAAIVAVLAMMF